METRTPSNATLKKYGLTIGEWLDLYHKKNGCCHICGKSFDGRRANVDHEHVPGWKKMPPEERKQHIRGLLCYTCNKFMVMRGMTTDRLYEGWLYMRRFEVRITADALVNQSRPLDPGQKRVKRRNIRHTDQQ